MIGAQLDYLPNFRSNACSGLQIRVQHWGGGGGGSAYFGDFFDTEGMILRFLFLMTFFLLARLFFHHFLLKFNYWGDGGQILGGGGGCIPYPPGICSPVHVHKLSYKTLKFAFLRTKIKTYTLYIYIYVYIYIDWLIDKFCVEVFEKTIRRTDMIDHSFERKLYGACYRYKNFVRGFKYAWGAFKVLKWDFY